MYPSPRAVFAAAIIWLGFAAAAVAAEPNAPAGATAPNPPAASARQSYGGAVQIPANGRPIALEVGKGTLIRLPRPANTVFVANPDIADVQIKSPTLVYVSAKAPGQTVIYAVDGNDAVLLNAAVRVDFDLSQFHQSLERLAPGNAISVTQVDSSLVLSGAVATAGQAEKIRTLAAAVTGGVKGSEVINRLSVATPNQVNLQVRIAEVDRNILKQIGIDWSKVGTSHRQFRAGSFVIDDQQPDAAGQFSDHRQVSLGVRAGTQRHHRGAGDRGLSDRSCRAQPDRDVGPDRELSGWRRIPSPGGAVGRCWSCADDHDRVQAHSASSWRSPRRSSTADHLNLKVPAGGQRAEHCRAR